MPVRRQSGNVTPADPLLRPKDGREVLFAAKVGSYNYNLQVEGSDEDFYVFTMPRYTDLYDGNLYTKQTITDDLDYTSFDLRRLPDLLWKSNPHTVELLFTKDLRVNTRMEYVEGAETFKLLDLPIFIQDKNESIARMNLPYLWDSTMGCVRSEMKRLKGNEEQELTKLHGYNTKAAMHAVRLLDLLDRYADSGFEDFESALVYNGQRRTDILDIRKGKYTYIEMQDVLNTRIPLIEEKWKDAYKSAKPKETTYARLKKAVYEVARIYTLYELERDMIWKA